MTENFDEIIIKIPKYMNHLEIPKRQLKKQ